jgi:hypothetical protein
MAPVKLLVLLALLQLMGATYGLIHDQHYESTTAFVDAAIHGFGLAEGGVVEVKYNITLLPAPGGSGSSSGSGSAIGSAIGSSSGSGSSEPSDDPSTSFLLLLLLLKDQYDTFYLDRVNRLDYRKETNYEQVQSLCALPSMFHKRLYPSNGSLEYFVAGSDLYDVLIVQCFPQQVPLVADISIEMRNPTSEGCCTGHLPIETVMSINIALAETILYSIMLISFLMSLFMAQKEVILPVHFLLLAAISISVLSSMMDYIGTSVQNDNGRLSKELAEAIYVFHFLETFSFKLSVLVLGMGWSFVRQNITMFEKGVIGVIFAGFAAVGFGQLNCLGDDVIDMSSGCQGLNLIEYVMAGLILLATIIALNYSVSQLRAIIANLNWNPSMPILYARLKQYNQFRNLFLVLLVVPTVMYMIEITVLTWKQKWIGNLGQALVKMVFIFYTGAIFVPLDYSLLNRTFNGSLNAS